MEKNVKIKAYIKGASLFLFFIGGMIYLMFRSESLVMFRWCEVLHVKEYVDSLRIPCTLPQWIVYSLPDGLWLCSYVLFVSAIWNFDLKQGWLYVFSLPIVAIGSELAQAFDWMRGTFDWIDLLCYVLGLLSGCMIVGYLNLRGNEKEKNVVKVVASVLSLCFYLFMAMGSDESSSDSPKNEEPVYTPSEPIEKEPVFSNDELEEEQDTILMKDTYDNDDILEE